MVSKGIIDGFKTVKIKKEKRLVIVFFKERVDGVINGFAVGDVGQAINILRVRWFLPVHAC